MAAGIQRRILYFKRICYVRGYTASDTLENFKYEDDVREQIEVTFKEPMNLYFDASVEEQQADTIEEIVNNYGESAGRRYIYCAGWTCTPYGKNKINTFAETCGVKRLYEAYMMLEYHSYMNTSS